MHRQRKATDATKRASCGERCDGHNVFQRHRGDGIQKQQRRKTLYVKIIGSETVRGYVDGIDRVKAMGYSVQAIVANGRRGIFNAFKDTPVQLCQFHQVKTVTNYFTKKPKLGASIELRILSLHLKNSDKEGFVRTLDEWYSRWEKTVNERT